MIAIERYNRLTAKWAEIYESRSIKLTNTGRAIKSC